ncbi:MAG: hypothetical protein J1G07_06885 [Clostridiales bacterium]|nr:hypothetical protein [Clostridiales bacterium]
MYKILRIAFCILSVLCVAVTLFIFVYFDWFGLIPLGGAIIFGFLMVYFKNLQQAKELKDNPPPPEGDFITGPVKKDGGKE